ncbi:MAG: sugar phosphate isomerase/epimerase [Anaerolineae bacterium]|nr:sugar phosphate isomerase/epimerase [Anaerolineae bacterium]
MWPFAVQASLVPGQTFLEKFKLLAAWGYDGIEISGADLLQHADALQKAAATYPVRLTSACAGFEGWLVDRNPRARRLAIEQIKAMLAVGADLGIAGLISPAAYGINAREVLPPYRNAFTLDEDRQLLIEGLTEIVESAARTGGTLLLEPLNRYVDRVLNTVAEAVTVVKAVDSPHLKVVPDIFHMNIEESNLSASLREAAPFIGHVHLSDSNRRLPGHGHVDWRAVFATLHDVGYNGVMAIECRIDGDPREALPRTLGFLREKAEAVGSN